jgi:hypothetical protein
MAIGSTQYYDAMIDKTLNKHKVKYGPISSNSNKLAKIDPLNTIDK